MHWHGLKKSSTILTSMVAVIDDKNNIPRLIEEFEKAKEQALREIGAEGEGSLKRTLTEGRGEWPSLKPGTIARKGSTRPLIDTGIMRSKITSRVDKDGSVVHIGLFGDDDSAQRSGRETVEIGLVHEFGTRDGNVPQRAWLRPTFDEEIAPGVPDIVSEKYNEAARRASL